MPTCPLCRYRIGCALREPWWGRQGRHKAPLQRPSASHDGAACASSRGRNELWLSSGWRSSSIPVVSVAPVCAVALVERAGALARWLAREVAAATHQGRSEAIVRRIAAGGAVALEGGGVVVRSVGRRGLRLSVRGVAERE
jgi:hypothetical protein